MAAVPAVHVVGITARRAIFAGVPLALTFTLFAFARWYQTGVYGIFLRRVRLFRSLTIRRFTIGFSWANNRTGWSGVWDNNARGRSRVYNHHEASGVDQCNRIVFSIYIII